MLQSGQFRPQMPRLLHKLLHSFDVVVEASGSSSGLSDAVSLVRPLGTIVLKTTCAPGGSSAIGAELNNAIVVNEIDVRGSRCGPFAPALGLLADGALGEAWLRRLVSAEYPLREAAEALKVAGQRGILKVQLKMAPSGLRRRSKKAAQ